MIVLTSFFHRKRLTEAVGNWLANRLVDEDLKAIKEIVNFNAFVLRPLLDEIASEVLREANATEVMSEPVTTKGALKDRLAASLTQVTPRMQKLLDRYHRFPEDYYRETPFAGRIYFTKNGDQRYLGSARIKRVRRIAEKSSRYVIDQLFKSIRRVADELAAERATSLRIPRETLITSAEDQIEEFRHAERRVLKWIRTGQVEQAIGPMYIHDVAGIKVIGDRDVSDRVMEFLARSPRSTIIEVEPHVGVYNATNIIVSFKVDLERLASRKIESQERAILLSRGLCPDVLDEAFRRFILSSEEEIHVELILQSYAEMVESELGRTMHEERIIAQRDLQDYRGPVALNVENLMRYLFSFALSSKTSIDKLPIQVWGRYLTDYYEHLLWNLAGVPGHLMSLQP